MVQSYLAYNKADRKWYVRMFKDGKEIHSDVCNHHTLAKVVISMYGGWDFKRVTMEELAALGQTPEVVENVNNSAQPIEPAQVVEVESNDNSATIIEPASNNCITPAIQSEITRITADIQEYQQWIVQSYEVEHATQYIAKLENELSKLYNNNNRNVSSIQVEKENNDMKLSTLMKKIPHEIWTRMHEQCDEFTPINAANECKYLISVILDGGSSYNDEPAEAKQIVKECKAFLKAYDKYQSELKPVFEEVTVEQPTIEPTNTESNDNNNNSDIINEAVEVNPTNETFQQAIERLTNGNWSYKNKKVPTILNSHIKEISETKLEYTITAKDYNGINGRLVRINKVSGKVTM